jgi:hypothetical protein
MVPTTLARCVIAGRRHHNSSIFDFTVASSSATQPLAFSHLNKKRGKNKKSLWPTAVTSDEDALLPVQEKISKPS